MEVSLGQTVLGSRKPFPLTSKNCGFGLVWLKKSKLLFGTLAADVSSFNAEKVNIKAALNQAQEQQSLGVSDYL